MQARLRAQLGDRSEYSGERRRRSVVVASIVLTITDPLRGSYPFWHYLQAALIRSYGASFACMELTIISRFQRLQASTKSLLHSLFLQFFSAFHTSNPYGIFSIITNYKITGTTYISAPIFKRPKYAIVCTLILLKMSIKANNYTNTHSKFVHGKLEKK